MPLLWASASLAGKSEPDWRLTVALQLPGLGCAIDRIRQLLESNNEGINANEFGLDNFGGNRLWPNRR
jgi:hypothetical protein